MPATTDRLDLRLSTTADDRLRRAAAVAGVSVAAFVRGFDWSARQLDACA